MNIPMSFPFVNRSCKNRAEKREMNNTFVFIKTPPVDALVKETPVN